MSDITSIYSGVKTKLATLFSDKFRLPDPYVLENNPETLLVNGYGIRVGGSTNPEFEFNHVSQTREFVIILTRENFKIDNNPEQYDDVSLLLLEDLKLLQNLFSKSEELGQELAIDYIELGSSSAIDEVITDKQNFLSLSQTINISFRELIGE